MSQRSNRRRRRQQSQNNLPPLSIIETRVSASSPHHQLQQQRPTNANTNRTGTATITTATAAQQQQQPSLLKALSESCKRHAATAHGGNATKQFCAMMLSEAPSYCQESVDKLVRIIPKVEEKCEKQDIAHMCDFYQDCLAGGFCPHAPHLFLSLSAILPRVYFLIRQLTEIPSKHICDTVAQLLNFVPDSNLLNLVIRDLIYLAKDLAILSQQSRSFDDDFWNATIEVALFEETIENHDWSQDKAPEYLVPITNLNALFSLQGSVLLILEELVTIRKNRRLAFHQNDGGVAAVLEGLDENYWTGGDLDLYFSGVINDDESLRTLLAALRSVLLTETPAKKTSNLTTLSKESAARVLLQLEADWRRTGFRTVATLQEVSLLVARAAVEWLKASSTSSGLDEDLAKLVHSIVFVPPSVHGSMRQADVASGIRKSVFSVLCESVCFMRCGADGENDSVSNQRALEIVLLQTIYAMMIQVSATPFSQRHHEVSTTEPRAVPGFRMMLTHDMIRHLFRLLTDTGLSESSVWILSDLICPSHSPSMRVNEIDNLVGYCLQETLESPLSSRDSEQLDDETNLSSATPGSKRKLPPSKGNTTESLSSRTQFAAMIKRRRVSYDSAKESYLRSFDDELAAFCIHALQSASRLRERLPVPNAASTDAGGRTRAQLSGDLLSHVIAVAIATRLFVAFIESHSLPNAACPQVWKLRRYLCETMLLVASGSRSTGERTGVQSLTDAVISCGIHVDFLLCTYPHLLYHPRESELLQDGSLLSFLDAAKDLYNLHGYAEFSSLAASSLPEVVQWTILNCAIRMQTSTKAAEPAIILLFGEILLSVKLDVECLNKPMVYCVGPLRLPINTERNLQRQRLSLLAELRHETSGPPIDTMSLEQNSFGLFASLDRTHPDPAVRLLSWQVTAWLFVAVAPQDFRRMLRSQAENESPSSTIGQHMLHFLLDVSFTDPDQIVRDYASRELGNIISAHDWESFLASQATGEEWQELKEDGSHRGTSAARHAIEKITSRFFRHVDMILHKNCSVPQSQLSFTVASSTKQSISPDLSSNSTLFFRRSAARALSSICQEIPSQNQCGRILFEHALIRVVRMWTGFDVGQRFDISGVCFAELSRLSRRTSIHRLLRDKYMPTFSPALFRDVLLPSSSSLAVGAGSGIESISAITRERQYKLLSAFMRTVFVEVCDQIDGIQNWGSDATDLERCLDSCIPYVISQLVVEKDYDALRLAAGYKLYLLSQKRVESKNQRRSETSYLMSEQASGVLIGESSSYYSASSSKSRMWNRDLETQTQQLCLAPKLIERLIPLIFVRAGPSELVFFTNVVLQNKVTLQQMVTSREQLLLKNFVLELGRRREMTGSLVLAMKKAAIAKNQESSNQPSKNSASSAMGELSDGNELKSVCDWVTSHFLYLLVNVVQYKWSSKTNDDRVQALRSLLSTLDFLRASESSQYFPQIMATVNAALSQDCDRARDDISTHSQLRLLAVQSLSKFVKLVAQQHWEVLGHNLTSIVVSLVPILSDDGEEQGKTASAECERDAVALLYWLTQGELGRNLAPFFSNIPFLPPSSTLDSVRASLRSLGVDFDNLHVVATQGSQQDVTFQSVGGESGSTGGDSQASNVARQGALRRRLDTVCSLLGNESASVRRVVLQHLAALLRANRDLFQALVENEGATSMKRYLTVAKEHKRGFSRGTVTEIIEVLLSRCANENDSDARILLATCLGEVGAIDAYRLEEANSFTDSAGGYSLKSSKPPWHITPQRCELRLIAKYLVAALKAAPTSADQHKIAYTIQQLLALLNGTGSSDVLTSPLGSLNTSSSKTRSGLKRRSPGSEGPGPSGTKKSQMKPSLVKHLMEAKVFDVVEPFWFSEFHEAENNPPKQPPFFRTSSTFYGWLSNWCRYMVHRAHDTRNNEWTEFFYACRTSLRTEAGLDVAEFLLPLLVLDRLCFGNGQDEKILLTEMHDALTFASRETSHDVRMNEIDRRKAVRSVLLVLDLLQHWAEPETEEKFTKKGQTRTPDSSNGQRQDAIRSSDVWLQEEPAMRIGDLVGAIPLELRAHAASCVGMHASALRLLEMASRSRVADVVFGPDSMDHARRNRSPAAGNCTESDGTLMKDVLASLNDYETMSSLGDDDFGTSPSTRVKDSIRQKEALRDWQGALQDYERAQQLNVEDPSLQLGSLHCLLELGHFESVLQQVNGINSRSTTSTSLGSGAVPLAVEASWRLGRWETLSELVETKGIALGDPEGLYQVSLAQTMLNVHKHDLPAVQASLRKSRCAAMEKLCSVARESYSRAYEHIVRLQVLREIEDISELLCSRSPPSLGELTNNMNYCWDRRLDLVSSSGATTIMNTRLALARLAGDSAFEGSLFLRMGKRARKSGLHGIAANSFAQAEAALTCIAPDQRSTLKSFLRMQFAKLKHDCGESSIALRILGQEDIETMGSLNDKELVAESVRRVVKVLGVEERCSMDEQEIIDVFVRCALQSTRWMIEGGLKGGGEIMARFRTIHRVSPKWEKGHFHFAKYIDSIMESRIMTLQGRSSDHGAGVNDDVLRSQTIVMDRTCQRYMILAIKHYAEALTLDIKKHVYQAMPRLLSLWFDLTSVKQLAEDGLHYSRGSKLADLNAFLLKSQEDATAFMALKFRKIPAPAFFTAIPQLISRIIHDDKDTASVVQGILKRVLVKYPAQAMWPLAWIRQSQNVTRRQIGDAIFRDAIRSLDKAANSKGSDLLVRSNGLITYLHELAKSEPTGLTKGKMKIKPFRDLSNFVPPIQAALSVSLAAGDSSRARDVFPRHVPVMRAFQDHVIVMMSKAKPKRLRVHVVSSDMVARSRTSPRGAAATDLDIGEIHFLLKQEAKGDLRKDARVQDLNNVVNRLMASSNDSKGLSCQRRRLHLRTFAVTCLSEDTGLLEWVPHTASLRSLIEKTHNPQAPKFSSKRRGRRLTAFNDPQIKVQFERTVQNMYFVSGNLTRAVALFEELCLKPYPPLFYWWFVQQFHDPHCWYEARTRFTLSAAAWSAVGHVIGLGDRHSENILVDSTTGECVHVDFDCIFDKTLGLPKPEVVPFRLTQNMVDAFGPTGADGIYASNLKVAMGCLRDNRDTLLSVLEPFVKDPVINWKRTRASQQRSSKLKAEKSTEDAKQKMNVIDERLRGIYNLRNPNHLKIRRTDGFENQQDEELSNLVPLSVEGQVHKLIAEATSHENLTQLYIGWMPWV